MLYHVEGRRKVHYTFPDHKELVEEYEASSGNILGKFSKHCFYLFYFILLASPDNKYII